ncbi:MAG: hypothetical protein ACQKBY_11945 [Verrucomicrobiales bacterium]
MSTQDNPIKRLSAFWLGLALFAVFALATLVFQLVSPDGDASATEEKAEARLEIKSTVDQAQAAALDPEALATAREEMVKTLISSTPKKGAMPVQQAPAAE